MMTKKNLAKAITLSLLLSTALSANAWALEINNATINSSSIVNDGRFYETNEFDFESDFNGKEIYSSQNDDKIILNNVNLTKGNVFDGFAGVSQIIGGTMTGDIQIIGNSSAENVNGNKMYLEDVKSDGRLFVFGGLTNGVSMSDNEVYVKGGNLYQLYGVDANIFAGNEAITNNNIIYLDGAEVKYCYAAFGNPKEAKNNGIVIMNGTKITGEIRATRAGLEHDNYITIIGDNDLGSAHIGGYGIGGDHKNVTLNLDGFNGNINQLKCFDVINFENLDLKKEDVFTVGYYLGGLEETEIKISSFADGQNIEVGDKVDLLHLHSTSSSTDWNVAFTKSNKQTITNVGLSKVVTSDIYKDDSTQTITATVAKIERNEQTNLVAENRAVAAAFVNQGTDLIADSLDTLSRDGKYGVKTFAAVHGNRSKYDVNSDIKINGWSTIVGVGSETEHNGGDFSWGVFYENGSGNYRTFNSFNNEFFRGDGSLVYNGGGIAARYENAHGVYTEGSLRAGMLKSEMTDALSDGENKYGYSSESEYYGAHIGIGQIIPLTESSDLDVYGKFFHTYTEGDSFNVAGDKFEFDSINSDRLRVGARLTTNKENKFSTYYGLAYEYEFNGDAEMRAAGMGAPTQSLQGSSVMAEIGLNYQPTPDSPWSFDLNMRGYAGERQGGSFNVQATYTF